MGTGRVSPGLGNRGRDGSGWIDPLIIRRNSGALRSRDIRLTDRSVIPDLLDCARQDPVPVPSPVGSPGPELAPDLLTDQDAPELRDLRCAAVPDLPRVVCCVPEPPHPDEGRGPPGVDDEVEGEIIHGERDDQVSLLPGGMHRLCDRHLRVPRFLMSCTRIDTTERTRRSSSCSMKME